MKIKLLKFLSCGLLAVFIIVGIPLIINELYKMNIGYITVWSGDDILSYYGSIIGALITGVTLVVTISFTKKQIERESYVNYETSRCKKLEKIFNNALDNINPMYALKRTMDNGVINPQEAIIILQKYQVDCSLSIDFLNSCLDIKEYPYIKDLLYNISILSQTVVNISQKGIEQYIKLRDLKHNENIQRIMHLSQQYRITLSQEEINEYYKLLNRTKDIKYEDIEYKISMFTKEMREEYNKKYIELLKLKENTFEKINKEILEKANRKL